MKKNLTKLALGSLNLISLVFTGQSLEAGTEEITLNKIMWRQDYDE